MYYTKNPWDQKEELKTKAREHTKEMQESFPEEISECIEKSLIYGGPDLTPKESTENSQPRFMFLNTDTVSALKYIKNATLLNFASYKNPGGRFYDGSKAQEEMLCHASFLYNVLRNFSGYYKWNAEHKNKALYADRAIFTPNVRFGEVKANIITCAAPNFGPALKYGNATAEENSKALKERIEFIKKIAEDNDVESLVLGAFGCGVFKQNPTEVATLIKEIFSVTSVENIVTSVPGNDANFKAFKEVFGEPMKIRER